MARVIAWDQPQKGKPPEKVTVTEKGFRMPRFLHVFFSFPLVFRYTVSRVSLSSKVPAGMLCRRWFRFLVSHILTP